MFWKKKPKPSPWYRKLWDEWRQLFVSLTTIVGLCGSAYAYVAVDVVPFIQTTSWVAAATEDTLYVQVDVEAELNEQAYVIVNLDDQQVAAKVYPKGIKEGEIIFEIAIPFTSDKNFLKVNLEIIIVGPRTLFLPQTLEETKNVERQIGIDSSNSSSSRGTGFGSPGRGIRI